MLDFLRRGVKTWVAKVLFGLLVVSFAIWGIGDVFSSGLGSSVATVGDQKITAQRYSTALNAEIRAQSQRFGQPIDADMARAIGLPQQVLARMAQEATLDQAMAELGVSASDRNVSDLVSNDPSFRTAAGGFDSETYRYLLAQSGFTIEDYEDATRRSIARTELAYALSRGGAAPAATLDALYAFQTEERTVDHFTLTAEAHGEDPGAPSEADLVAYHEANAATFTAPERRTAVYLHLDLDVLGADFEPDEAEIETLYDLRSAEYALPETRALYQIVYGTEAEAAEAVRRVSSGETDFDGLLADRGESRSDASLGEVTAEEIPSAAGVAAFERAAEGLAGPVNTGFGFAVVDVAAITPAEVTSLEDARPELVRELRREAALDRAPEIAGEIDDQRAGGATLEEIAADLRLPLLTAESVARSGEGAEGFAREGVFLAELFASEDGEERDIQETDEGAYFVLRVDGIEESALRPLADVRGAVEIGWRAEAALAALRAKADELMARIEGGEDITAVAEEVGAEVGSEGPLTRSGGWNAISPQMVETLFQGEVGVGAVGVAPGRPDAVTVAAVSAVVEGAPTEANTRLRTQLEQQLSAMAGDDALTLFLTAKQQTVGVTVNDQLIDSLLVNQGGHGGGY